MNKCDRCQYEDTSDCKNCNDKNIDPLEEMIRKALEKEERRITGKEKPIDEK